MNNSSQIRNKDIDFIRGIAIILVVYGHIGLPLGNIISFFHMPLFFFISGGVYRKCSFKEQFIKKTKRLYFQFLKYEFIFLILQNFFVKLNIYSKDLYISNMDDWKEKIVHMALFDNTISLLSPMWFITVLFLVNILYWFIDYGLKNIYLKLIISFCCLLIGNFFTIKHWLFIESSCFNQNVINVTLVAVFYFCLGDIFYKFYQKTINQAIEKSKYQFIMVWIFILICFFVNMFSRYILKLSGGMRLNDYSSYTLFFICSLCGIIMTYLFSYCFVHSHFNKVINFICYLGNNTFLIMGLHQLYIKLVIGLYFILEANQSWQFFSEVKIHEIGYIYRILALVLGVLLPVGMMYIVNNVKKIKILIRKGIFIIMIQSNKFKKFLKEEIIPIINILNRTLFKYFLHIKFKYTKTTTIGKNVAIYPYVTIINNKNGVLQIGNNVRIHKFSKITFIKNKGVLKIGNNCTLGDYGQYNVQGKIILGDNIITSDRVSFISSTHYYSDINKPINEQGGGEGDIIVGDGSWIALNAVILDGTILGKNTIVGANSVVKGVFPDYCVLAGAPAKIVKQYDEKLKKYVKVIGDNK